MYKNSCQKKSINQLHEPTVYENRPNLIQLKFFLCRYLALEGLCSMANSEFSADAVRKHQETVVSALKVRTNYYCWRSAFPKTFFSF